MNDFTSAGAQPYGAHAEAPTGPGEAVPADVRLRKPHAAATGCTNPCDLLRPECRAIDLLGRTDELAVLMEWLAAPAAVSVRCLVGRAGTGKTRLAIELCARAEALGWSAGLLAPDALQFCAIKTSRGAIPLLAVIDPAGAEAQPAQDCAGLAAHRRAPLRVLLVDREPATDGWPPGRAAIDLAEPIWLGGLRSASDRRRLLGLAMAQAARLTGAPVCPPPAGAALDTGDPMHLLMAGLVAPHPAVAAALARPPACLAATLAEREMDRLERLAGHLHLEPFLLTHIAACITLQGGCRAEAAPGLIVEEAQAFGLSLPASPEHVADCAADALLAPERDVFEAIGPDLVGEAFVIRALTRHPADAQIRILDRALRRAPVATAAMVRRAAHDHAGGDPLHPALAWSRHAGA